MPIYAMPARVTAQALANHFNLRSTVNASRSNPKVLPMYE